MAEKPMSNFKTAVNELMNGKLKTDDEFPVRSLGLADSDTVPTFRPPEFSFETAPSTGGHSSDNISVLSSDPIIEGTVKSKSDIKLNGYVKGDMSCGGTIISAGTVDGNIDAANITLNGSTVTGNINVRGSITIDSSSSITGDIAGSVLLSDGKVKGNIILKDSITLHANSSVYGNIKAKNISIEAGSTLVGNLEIKASNAAPAEPAPKQSPPAKPAPEQVAAPAKPAPEVAEADGVEAELKEKDPLASLLAD